MRGVALLAVLVVVLAACGTDDANITATLPAGSAVEPTTGTTQATVPPTVASEASGASTTPAETGERVNQWQTPPEMALDESKTYGAVIKTSKGDITVELYAKEAPKTVNNFVFLAEQGYYDDVVFHRIISGFMIQTGDPTGTGAGGPGYRFEDELSAPLDYERGTLAMANAGPNTNGSQFFICHADLSGGRLPKNYSIFGKVVDGMDVVDAIANSPVGMSPRGENSVPQERIVIESVEITTK